MEGPSAVAAVKSVLFSLATVRHPRPLGTGEASHSGLAPVLEALVDGGLEAVQTSHRELSGYLEQMSDLDPDSMSREHALAFWLNLYNAQAIAVAVEAHQAGENSVMRLPGAFTNKRVSVAGERLSLDDIEHAKVRRFGDPRIHAALVCGSLSCPTLRPEPYGGGDIARALEEQMLGFIRSGGARPMGGGGVALSRIFLWYGADFVRPHRMPTLLPATRGSVLAALRQWLPSSLASAGEVSFQEYDWGLGCAVG